MDRKQYYKVAEHCFCLQLSENSPLWKRLENYAPFTIEEPKPNKMAFTLRVTEDTIPVKNPTDRCIGEFDCDAAYLKLFELTDGEKLFLISQGSQQECSHLQTDPDYRNASLCFSDNIPNGLRIFAVNNAIMLLYAFTTATHNTLLIHASVIVNEEKGYVFLGKSGTGKSTHSQLWLKYIPDSYLLNDDNPVIQITQEGIYVYGSPWSGKTPCYRNEKAILGGIVRLSQAPQNQITPLKGVMAYAAVTPSVSVMRWERAMADGIHNTLSDLIPHTPVYHLQCLPDEAAAHLCATTLRKKNLCND